LKIGLDDLLAGLDLALDDLIAEVTGNVFHETTRQFDRVESLAFFHRHLPICLLTGRRQAAQAACFRRPGPLFELLLRPGDFETDVVPTFR
jgi:hypothetical protein